MKFPLPEQDLILDWKRRLVFWSGAVTVGLVAILFAVASEWANGVFHKMLAMSSFLPLMAAAFIAKACSRLIFPTPIFHTMAENFIYRPPPPKKDVGTQTAFIQRESD